MASLDNLSKKLGHVQKIQQDVI